MNYKEKRHLKTRRVLRLGDIVSFEKIKRNKMCSVSILDRKYDRVIFNNGDNNILFSTLLSEVSIFSIVRLMCEAAGLKGNVKFLTGKIKFLTGKGGDNIVLCQILS